MPPPPRLLLLHHSRQTPLPSHAASTYSSPNPARASPSLRLPQYWFILPARAKCSMAASAPLHGHVALFAGLPVAVRPAGIMPCARLTLTTPPCCPSCSQAAGQVWATAPTTQCLHMSQASQAQTLLIPPSLSRPRRQRPPSSARLARPPPQLPCTRGSTPAWHRHGSSLAPGRSSGAR